MGHSNIWTCLFISLVVAGCATTQPAELRCEYATNPLGIDEAKPRLSWVVQSQERGDLQTAFQLLVASSEQNLRKGQGDLWDTGKVASAESIQVAYAGKELQSGQRCYWRVRVWNKQGKASAWSEPTWWEMGLLNASDWSGRWINDGEGTPAKQHEYYGDDPAPLFRREFTVDKPIQRARLYISGLGYYEAQLNGQRVGDHVLDPGWTTYGKRVLYSTYDVTDQLQKGRNCLGVMLGNGWYNPLPMPMWGRLNLREHLVVGRPRFIAQLNIEYADGTRRTVVSDQTWRTGEGPIVRNSVYLGEVYDAREEQDGWSQPGFDASYWRRAAIAREPMGPLMAQVQPPIRITATLKPVKITEPKPGVFIFDMGQNFAGWVKLNVQANKSDELRGQTIRLRYGELLNADGTLNVLTSTFGQLKRSNAENPWAKPQTPELACQCDIYIAKGEGNEQYTPRFTFHGFRYVEVSGYPGRPTLDAIQGLRLSADVKSVGSFECSNEMLNRVQRAAQWTFLSNLFSVQSDCPHREKFGYGGDMVPTSESFLLNFDMAGFYTKAMNDFADAARANGGITETAPYVGIADSGLGQESGPIGWQVAFPFVQQKLYQYCGDRRLVERQYPAIQRMLALIQSKAPDGILDACIGDHESLDPKPTALTSTAFYYDCAKMAAEFARILGRTDDQRQYEQLAEQIKAKFIARFYKPATGQFDTGTETCQAFALHYNLVPADQREKAFKALVQQASVKDKGHVKTGIFGTKLLLDTLSRNGHADLAYQIASQESFPGWGHMLKNGATTLWETWAFSDNIYSHNHPMFGSISAWMYETIGGIRAAEDAVGFDRIIVRPLVSRELTWAKADYQSIRGPVRSDWRLTGDRLQLKVTIPVGATAIVYVPTVDSEKVQENGRAASQSPGVKSLGLENGAAKYRVESGEYTFTAPWAPAH
ncbi:MAG TPA: family 78 glycoside hydrolase catalytic domain [Tepidisphaeraceae bacterium]|nr:family 78 glycoside hydrolase catalytic domain [Tepidisphaeraceae bacterium]